MALVAIGATERPFECYSTLRRALIVGHAHASMLAGRPELAGHSSSRFRVTRTGAFGFALGLLLTTFSCAAIAAQSLHTGLQVVDWALGIALLALPLAVLFALLRLASNIAGRILRGARFSTAARIAHAVGHPLIATTAGIIALIWLTPADSVVSLYHGLYFFEIMIVSGAVVGLLAGIGFGLLEEPRERRSARLPGAATLAAALVIAVSAIGWAAMPGFGESSVREPASSLTAIPALGLTDPSVSGSHQVTTVSYGSGHDARRPEFGAQVGWVTRTVDASFALEDRGPIGQPYADWFWGYDSGNLPLNGRVWYPADRAEPMPLTLIVHGNHQAAEYSDPGYAYLAEHLASRGIIAATIDENYLNGDAFFDYGGSEMGVRSWLLLHHLAQFAAWNTTAGHPLEGRIDLDRVALIGHSRGGEAATVAAMLNQRPDTTPDGLEDVQRGYGIRAVIAIAPSDGMYRGSGSGTRLLNVDYLAIQGARDGDLPAFSALQPYHRVEFDEPGHLKVALYSARANHGQFNSIWDYGDAGPNISWMLDRGAILSVAEQQRLAKTVIAAFLARSIQHETAYDAFFREPRAGRDWLPDDLVQTHWESSGVVVVDSMELIEDERKLFTGFGVARTVDPPLRDGTTQRDRAVLLEWNGPASLMIPVAPEVSERVPSGGSLVFSMAPASEAEPAPDPTIQLRSSDGSISTTRLSLVAAARPLIPVQLWKFDGLGDRYLVEERHDWSAEQFMQTYEVPLAAFDVGSHGENPRSVVGIALLFDGQGSVYLDDIGFEGPVTR